MKPFVSFTVCPPHKLARLMLTLCWLLVAGASPAAWAGTWSGPAYTCTARTAAPGGDTTSPNSGGSSGPDSASSSATVEAVFTWVPDPGQTITTDPPPDTLFVRETARAEWNFSTYMREFLIAATADNGLGDAVVVSTSGFSGVSSGSRFTTTDNIVSVAGKFETYLMYKPSGTDSIWVTLGLLNWSWNGAAGRDTDGVWQLGTGASPQTGDPNPKSVNNTQLPKWTDNYTAVKNRGRTPSP